MSSIAVIGARPEVFGFALAGARVYPTETPDDIWAAWRAVPDSVAVVILTRQAAEVLGDSASGPPSTVVLP